MNIEVVIDANQTASNANSSDSRNEETRETYFLPSSSDIEEGGEVMAVEITVENSTSTVREEPNVDDRAKFWVFLKKILDIFSVIMNFVYMGLAFRSFFVSDDSKFGQISYIYSIFVAFNILRIIFGLGGLTGTIQSNEYLVLCTTVWYFVDSIMCIPQSWSMIAALGFLIHAALFLTQKKVNNGDLADLGERRQPVISSGETKSHLRVTCILMDCFYILSMCISIAISIYFVIRMTPRGTHICGILFALMGINGANTTNKHLLLCAATWYCIDTIITLCYFLRLWSFVPALGFLLHFRLLLWIQKGEDPLH
jgi:hypothetical protein